MNEKTSDVKSCRKYDSARRLLLMVLVMGGALASLNAAQPSIQGDALYQEMLKAPQFKAADKELTSVYLETRKNLDPLGQTQLRDQQREWLKSRDEKLLSVPASQRPALAARLTQDRARELSSPKATTAQALPPAPKTANTKTEANIAKLRASDADTRVDALRDLEYSLDPRLPKEMLAMLSDSGESIVRIAAHGIGSRWWQIPKEEIAMYVKALKKLTVHKDFSVVREAQRSICILQKSVGKEIEDSIVSVSPNRRWMIYDRLGLPCLIDRKNESEELLAWKSRPDFSRFDGGTIWHPSMEAAAMILNSRRGIVGLIVWKHGSKPIVADPLAIFKKKKFNPGISSISVDGDSLKWNKSGLSFDVSFFDEKKERECSAKFSWDANRNSLTMGKVDLNFNPDAKDFFKDRR